MTDPGRIVNNINNSFRTGFRPAGIEVDFSDEEICHSPTTKQGKLCVYGGNEWDGGTSAKRLLASQDGYHKQSLSGGKTTSISPSTAAKRDNHGGPLISDDFRLAVCGGNLQEVQYFIDKGIVADVPLRAGWTALMYAASSGHAHIVKFLLERGADANFNKAPYMYTPLIAAAASVQMGNIASCVTILLEKGANPNVHERSHMTPLMFVSKSGVCDAVRQLLHFGAQIDRQDNRGWTALCYAAEQGFTSIVKCLIDVKADTEMKCSEGTPSDIAYNRGHFELADMISRRVGQSCEDIPERSAKVQQQESLSSTDLNQISRHCSDDLDLFLFGLDLGNLVPIFHHQRVNFSILLQMSQDDLEKIGIDKYGWRCKIMDAVYAIHKRRWEPGSLRAPGKRILSQSQSKALIDNISTHVTYIGSSMKYIGSNWMTHKTLFDQQQDSGNLDLLVMEVDKSLEKTAKLFDELKKLKGQLQEAVQSGIALPPDLILEPSGKPRYGKTLTAVITIAALTTAVLVMCNKF